MRSRISLIGVVQISGSISLPQIAVKEITRLIDEGKFNQPLEDVVDMILRRENYQHGSSGFEKYPELDEE